MAATIVASLATFAGAARIALAIIFASLGSAGFAACALPMATSTSEWRRPRTGVVNSGVCMTASSQ